MSKTAEHDGTSGETNRHLAFVQVILEWNNHSYPEILGRQLKGDIESRFQINNEWDSHTNFSLGQVRETVLGRHPRNSYLHHVDLPHAACGLHRGISHQDQNHPPANFWDPIPCCHSWPKWDARSTWICQEEWKHGFNRGTTTERLKYFRSHLSDISSVHSLFVEKFKSNVSKLPAQCILQQTY